MLVACSAVTLAIPLLSQDSSKKCDAPEYFGMCDPFVPGTLINGGDNKPFNVISTWSMGPAEKAGICPGDHIIAVNKISAFQNTYEQLLKQMVSDSPSPVLLEIKRGDHELEFNVPRVRESTLVELSHQKFMRTPEAQGHLLLVPLNETADELAQIDIFWDQIARRHGFKMVGGWPVPLGTAEDQFRRILKLKAETPSRVTVWTGLATGHYAPGFIAMGLKEPSQVLIARVVPGSPANYAGLLPGDELLAVDGHPVAGLNSEQLKKVVFTPDERRKMSLRLQRNGSEIDLRLETELVDEFEKRDFEIPIRAKGKPTPGAYVVGISALYGDSPARAVVEEVKYPSPAFDAGLHLGDEILAVNGEPIASREQLASVLFPVRASELDLEISRLGRKLTFRVKPLTYEATLAKIGRKLTSSGPAPLGCAGSSLENK